MWSNHGMKPSSGASHMAAASWEGGTRGRGQCAPPAWTRGRHEAVGRTIMNLPRRLTVPQGGPLARVPAEAPGAPAMADFAYTDFTSANNLSFNGAAVQTGSTLS